MSEISNIYSDAWGTEREGCLRRDQKEGYWHRLVVWSRDNNDQVKDVNGTVGEK